MTDDKNTTHFGFQEIPAKEKTARVAEVFHSVATRYDVMNDLMSMGMHRLWKRYAIQLLDLKPHHSVLDLAAGTADLSKRMAKKLTRGKLVVSDINHSMLTLGRDRLIDEGCLHNVTYVEANAESLPFADEQFDAITIGFGLRNVTDQSKALAEMHRVLKVGGKVLILEFSKVNGQVMSKLYDQYSFKLLPFLGKHIAKDEDSYQYLAESIRKHPDQETLKSMMENVGFEGCLVNNLLDGIVAIHRGWKLA